MRATLHCVQCCSWLGLLCDAGPPERHLASVCESCRQALTEEVELVKNQLKSDTCLPMGCTDR